MSTLDGAFQRRIVARIDELTRDSIQEALRMYLQPIKKDDHQVDFYTMYKRETMEYDSEYMQKHNEDLNTTLIFVRFCFLSRHYAALTAFLRPACSELRSELRLRHRRPVKNRARLRRAVESLSPSNSPQPQPDHHSRRRSCHSPSVERSPPYVGFLMSLLAAFVAMLGKQWLNRYLRHTGGSVIERCGDRQRKFDGLRNGPSVYSWKVSPPCSRLPSFSSPVACTVPFRPTRLVIVIKGSAGRVFGQVSSSSGGPPLCPTYVCHQFFRGHLGLCI